MIGKLPRKTLVLASVITIGLVVIPGSARAKDQFSKVELVSSVARVTPGQAFEVGVRFQLTDGWHIYWKNPGDGGQAPSATWTLPEGFSAGELEFPAPKRHVAPGPFVTNIHEGQPMLTSTITPPDSVASESVTLQANIRYLICSKTCLIRKAELKLVLPVANPNAAVEPANEEFFKRARRQQPGRKSKYLSIQASTHPRMPQPGQAFELVVKVNIKRGYHIQSHEPLNPSFIKADLFLNRPDGVFFEDAVYPPPKLRKVQYLGQLSEYAGNIVIRVPGEVDPDAEATPTSFGGVFKYQACNEKGTCFPPATLAFSLDSRQAATITAPEGVKNVALSVPPAVARGAESTTHETPAVDDARDAPSTAAQGGLEAFLAGLGVFGQLSICFLYGLLINATPCVLPLLSIKVLTFVQQAHESRGRTLVLGLAFGTGVMVFFVALGLLAAQGKNVLQYPVAVIALGTVVTALALSMLGVFTLQAPTSATKLEASIQKEGVLSSLGKGALAPVLGFACTAPMMATGMAWAAQQTPEMAVLAFGVMGFGMASPYILLGAFPNWLGFLPKPGQWMITFERLMGFLLLGFVVLLLHPLIAHLGAEGLEWTLVFLVTVGLACWVWGQVNMTMPSSRRWRLRGGAAGIVALSGTLIFAWIFPLGQANPGVDGHGTSLIAWQRWSPEAVKEAVESGKTVWVDVTAAYCTNCKVNKATAVNKESTRQKIKALGVATFQADFTKGDPQIFEELLLKHGRAGPPLDLIYPAGRYDNPIVLNALFSHQTLLAKLDEAGPSRSVLSTPNSASKTAGMTP